MAYILLTDTTNELDLLPYALSKLVVHEANWPAFRYMTLLLTSGTDTSLPTVPPNVSVTPPGLGFVTLPTTAITFLIAVSTVSTFLKVTVFPVFTQL